MKSATLTLFAGSFALCAFAAAAQTLPTQTGPSMDARGPERSNFARDRNVSVSERPHPEYDALGIPAGGFRLFPKFAVSAVADNNIFVDETDKTDDSIIRTQADLVARSGWSRHRLSGFARVINASYLDNKDEGYTDYQVGGSGQIDVKRDFSLEGGGDIGRLTESRTDNNSPAGVVEPVRYDRQSLNLQAAKTLNRLRLLGRVDWTSLDYKNGVSALGEQVFQDGRDRDVGSYTFRGEYAVSPDTAFFVEAVYNNREYDFRSTAGSTRDSDGSEISLGANFDLSNLVRGEVQVGYVQQDYDLVTLADLDAVSAHARIEWFPTQLITFRFDAGRSIEDATGVNTSGYLSTFYGLGADYEIQRNIILSAAVTGEKADFAGVSREDDKWATKLGATYKLNRTLSIKGEFEHLERDSNQADSDFKINRFGLTLTLQR